MTISGNLVVFATNEGTPSNILVIIRDTIREFNSIVIKTTDDSKGYIRISRGDEPNTYYVRDTGMIYENVCIHDLLKMIRELLGDADPISEREYTPDWTTLREKLIVKIRLTKTQYEQPQAHI